MSYYTRVTFEFSGEPPGVDGVSEAVRAWLLSQNRKLSQNGVAHYGVEDFLGDFLRGWSEGETVFNKIYSVNIEALMVFVSAQYPRIRFYVRGMGEEFDDVWLRQFEGGKTVFSLGPFELRDE